MKPFNLLLKLSYNNVIDFMSKGTNAFCTICKASGLVRSVSSAMLQYKSVIGQVLMGCVNVTSTQGRFCVQWY